MAMMMGIGIRLMQVRIKPLNPRTSMKSPVA